MFRLTFVQSYENVDGQGMHGCKQFPFVQGSMLNEDCLSASCRFASSTPMEISTYLLEQTLAFQPHIFPEQLSTALDPAADHMHQTDAVV